MLDGGGSCNEAKRSVAYRLTHNRYSTGSNVDGPCVLLKIKMSRQTGIHNCQTVTKSIVGNCVKGDFENHSFEPPSLFRHSSKDAMTDLYPKKKLPKRTVEQGGPPDQSPQKYLPSRLQTCIVAETSGQWRDIGGRLHEGRWRRGEIGE